MTISTREPSPLMSGVFAYRGLGERVFADLTPKPLAPGGVTEREPMVLARLVTARAEHALMRERRHVELSVVPPRWRPVPIPVVAGRCLSTRAPRQGKGARDSGREYEQTSHDSSSCPVTLPGRVRKDKELGFVATASASPTPLGQAVSGLSRHLVAAQRGVRRSSLTARSCVARNPSISTLRAGVQTTGRPA